MMKIRNLSLLLIICLCVLLGGCKSKLAKEADALIDGIGDVTLESLEAIEEAEKAVEALTDEDKEQLENTKTLTDARNKYEALVIDDMIASLGTDASTISGPAIYEARASYNSSKKEVRVFVTNLDDLVYAENKYTALPIEKNISKIGNVDVSNVQAFNIAYIAYNNASDDVKKVVDNADILEEVKDDFIALAANEVVELINSIGDVTVDDEELIDNAKTKYATLFDESKQLVTNHQVLVDAESALEVAKEKEKEAALNAALSRVRTKEDRVDGVTWYQSNREPYYANSRSYVLPYIGKFSSNNVLHVVYHYTGDDWIFYEQIDFLIDGERSTKYFSYGDVDRDNGSGDVWERMDASGSDLPQSDIGRLWKIANSTETIIRFKGDNYHYDLTVSAADKQAIKDILTIYEAWTKK